MRIGSQIENKTPAHATRAKDRSQHAAQLARQGRWGWRSGRSHLMLRLGSR
jgi:hypothetical protein